MSRYSRDRADILTSILLAINATMLLSPKPFARELFFDHRYTQAFAFFVLGMFIAFHASKRLGRLTKAVPVWISLTAVAWRIIGAIVFAGLLELCQNFLGRLPRFGDFSINAVSILLGALMLRALLHKKWQPGTSEQEPSVVRPLDRQPYRVSLRPPEARFAKILQRARSKILVVAVTADRAGTRRIAELFKSLSGLHAIRDDAPDFSQIMRKAQTRPELAEAWVRTQMIPYLASLETDVYARMDHLVGQGIVEPLLNFGLYPEVILLRRPPRRVARSYLDTKTIPGRTALGMKFCLHPADPGVMKLPGYDQLSNYQLCFWYALEMERRQMRYRGIFERLGCPVVDATADELHSPQRWRDCLDALGLDTATVPQTIARAVERENHREIALDIDFDAEEAEIWALVSQAEPTLRGAVDARYT